MEQAVQQERAAVLVVDDNPLIVNVLKSLLLSCDYQVYTATNGEEALKVVESKQLDLIICDVMMPVMDGYAFHKALRQIPEHTHVPFIFLTALAEREEVTQGMEAGADDYLVKPFDPEVLLSIVKGKVSRSRQLKSQAGERYDSYRKKVIHTLSHEFRTPLVAINTGTEILIDQKKNLDLNKVQNLLEAIRRGGQRLERLVNDFMLLQQVEGGVAERLFRDRAERADIVNFVRELCTEEAQNLKKEGCELRYIEHLNSAQVKFYGPQIREILLRVISNAAKFSADQKEIEVHIYAQEKELVIEVRDRGIGIDLKRIQEAIDPFGQIDRERLEQQGGGLGLAIANRYALMHGGRLEFERRPGGGSLVSLTLPLAKAA